MLFIRRYVQTLLRFRRTIVLAVAVLTALFGLAARHLHVEMDPENMLPGHHPFVVVDRAITQHFGGRRFVVIALVPKRGTVWSVPVLRRLAGLTLDLYRAKGVRPTNVISLTSPNVRDIHATEETLEIEYLARRPPEAEADVQAIRKAYRRNPLYHGLLVSEDERAAMVLVDFWDDMDSEEIFQTVSQAAAPYRSPDLDIHITGLSIFSHYVREYARALRGYFALAVIAIMAVLYAAFGSVQGMIVPLSTGLLATVWGLGLMRLAGGQLDSYNVMAPILILAVGAGHSVQMLKRYYDELAVWGDSDRAVIESTTRIGVVMIAAGLTASLGFLSLMTFDAPSMRAFGLFTALGILSAVAIEMTFVPALRAMLPAPKEREIRAERNPGIMDWLVRKTARLVLGPRGRLIPIAAGVLVLVALAGAQRLEVNNTVKSLLPRDSVPKRDLEAIDAHFPGATNMTVLVRRRGTAELATPAVFSFIESFQRDLERDPLVYRTSSIVDLLKRMHMAMHADDPAFRFLPKDRNLIAQYLLLGHSPASERFLDRPMEQAAVWAYLRNDDARAIHRLIERARRFAAKHAPPQVEVLLAGGAGPLIVALNDEVVEGKIRNVFVVGTVIYAVASLLFRSMFAGLLVVLPLAITVIANLGTLGLLGLQLNIVTASVVGMAVGIGADYAIYLLYRTREEYLDTGLEEEAIRSALRTSGKAVVFVALAISTGYATLMASPFAAYWLLGLTVPVTMGVSCAASITLLPFILARIRPRFTFPSPETVGVPALGDGEASPP